MRAIFLPLTICSDMNNVHPALTKGVEFKLINDVLTRSGMTANKNVTGA